MPVFWGIVPPERPVQRETLVRMQRSLPPQTWRRQVDPLIRAGVSGRGDALLVLAWTAQMLSVERSAGVRFLQLAGIRPGHRVANTLPGALTTPGSLLLGDVVEDLGALDIPLGPITNTEGAARCWELLRMVEPQALVLEAATAPVFFADAPPAQEWSLNAVIWLHREIPTAWPRLPQNIGAERTLHWLTVPEVQCFFAHSCEEGHFHLDQLLQWRVVDPSDFSVSSQGWLEVAWHAPEQGELQYLVPWRVTMATPACSCGGGAALELLQAPPLRGLAGG